MATTIIDADLHSAPGDLKAFLQERFTKVKSPWFNSKMILILSGPALVRIKQSDGRIKIDNTLNTQYWAILVPFMIGVIFGFIGSLIVLAIAYPATSNSRAVLQEEVEAAVNEFYHK
jgi:hypothetical protein